MDLLFLSADLCLTFGFDSAGFLSGAAGFLCSAGLFNLASLLSFAGFFSSAALFLCTLGGLGSLSLFLCPSSFLGFAGFFGGAGLLGLSGFFCLALPFNLAGLFCLVGLFSSTGFLSLAGLFGLALLLRLLLVLACFLRRFPLISRTWLVRAVQRLTKYKLSPRGLAQAEAPAHVSHNVGFCDVPHLPECVDYRVAA